MPLSVGGQIPAFRVTPEGVIASLDVGSKMMEGKEGKALIDDTVEEAIVFRKKMDNLDEQIAKEENKNRKWFFKVWQPEQVTVERGNPTAIIIRLSSQHSLHINCLPLFRKAR